MTGWMKLHKQTKVVLLGNYIPHNITTDILYDFSEQGINLLRCPEKKILDSHNNVEESVLF